MKTSSIEPGGSVGIGDDPLRQSLRELLKLVKNPWESLRHCTCALCVERPKIIARAEALLAPMRLPPTDETYRAAHAEADGLPAGFVDQDPTGFRERMCDVEKIDLNELATMEAKATAGPWYAHNADDDACMNAYCVTAHPGGPWPEEFRTDCITMTLLQSAGTIVKPGAKWAEDADLIAAARNTFPALLRAVAATIQYLDVGDGPDGAVSREMYAALGPFRKDE